MTPSTITTLGPRTRKRTIATRFGTREKLERCVAILRANGLDVYIDVVDNHRDGGNNKTYRYVDADGKPNGGRFAKNPGDFSCGCGANVPGCVPEDPNVPSPWIMLRRRPRPDQREAAPATASTACSPARTG